MLTARATLLQLPLLLVFCLFSIQGACGLQCYSCKDTGDGGCDRDKAQIVLCPNAYDVCLQTLTTVNISFTSLKVLAKGCGPNVAIQSPIQKSMQAFASMTEINACSTDLCNTQQFEAAVFPLTTMAMNTSRLNTAVECYGCISISQEQCMGQQDKKMTCAGQACATGYLEIELSFPRERRFAANCNCEITVPEGGSSHIRQLHLEARGGQQFLTVFFQDCGRWGPQTEMSFTWNLEVLALRQVCTGALCNAETATTTKPTITHKSGSAALACSHLLLLLVLVASTLI